MLVGGIALTITSLEGMVLTPLLLSRAGSLNHVAIFTAIAFWSWAWGASGMLLAVPMLMAFKAVCDHVEGLEALADMLGTRDEPEPRACRRRSSSQGGLKTALYFASDVAVGLQTDRRSLPPCDASTRPMTAVAAAARPHVVSSPCSIR